MKEIKNKSQSCLLIVGIFLSVEAMTECDKPGLPYDRGAFGYNAANTDNRNVAGFYTGVRCDRIELDHVVSLKDAWLTGAWQWDAEKLRRFSNDQSNLVPACASINRSKGASTPADFRRKSSDERGLDYKIVNWCGYLARYQKVKASYGLSYCNNSKMAMNSCATLRK